MVFAETINMASVFISYSHDPASPAHAEAVAGLAAALMRDGMTVFFDQNRGDEEERVPWPIWMEDKIEEAEFVLLVCTELYYNKVRQKVDPGTGLGVCWEANLIYNALYIAKLNTKKFVPILLFNGGEQFIPGPLRGGNHFFLNSDHAYGALYAFLTGQHRRHFPSIGNSLLPVAQKEVAPLFSLPTQSALEKPLPGEKQPSLPGPAVQEKPLHRLRRDEPPLARCDIRGLDWYEECDAGHFLGRTEPINHLLAMLLSNPVVRLMGASGIGKSSLIRAGLLPKIREFGWRSCVIRPFEDPAQRIPEQLSAKLLTGDSAFESPFDPKKFREEISRVLEANRISRLVLLVDQVEDIVSLTAARDAMDTLRLFMQELWENKDRKPYLRAVLVSRTEADLALARLWQQISGKNEGVPYLALQGLTIEETRAIIDLTARTAHLTVDQSAGDVALQLATESQAFTALGEVFPVYLQIFLKQMQDGRRQERRARPDEAQTVVPNLIGRFLEDALAKLEARGGDWRYCGTVLESLSRSAGTKATKSLEDMARETGIDRSVLSSILGSLVVERLVRPVGHETYEIQHDRLASAVIDKMKASDREAKAASEFLSSKAVAYEWTGSPLSPGELTYLYRHRRRIAPTDKELRVLFLSTAVASPVPGWFWVRNMGIPDLAPLWRRLAADPNVSVRRGAAEALASFSLPEDLPLLRQMTKDQSWNVRQEAVKALASFSLPEDLPLLREMAKDQDNDVRQETVRALAGFSLPEDLPLLNEMSKDGDSDVREEAVEAIATFPLPEALSHLRQVVKDQNWNVRQEAVKGIGSFSLAEDLPLLREMAKDQDNDVRGEAVKAIASSLAPEDLPLLRQVTKDPNGNVRQEAVKAIASFAVPEDLPLLREMAEDQSADVRQETVKAVASFSLPEDFQFLCKMAKDLNGNIRREAVKALGSFNMPAAQSALREMIKDPNGNVRKEAVRAIASFLLPEDLPLVREMAKDESGNVRQEVVKAIASFSLPEDVSLLREMAKDQHGNVREEAVRAIANLSLAEAHSVLRELRASQDWKPALSAIEALAKFCMAGDASEAETLPERATTPPEGSRDKIPAWLIDEARLVIEEYDGDPRELVYVDELLYRPR
ncbi:MAG TPA: HEAT repeat domain-containing protein [Bryobacteraceae bacterium]